MDENKWINIFFNLDIESTLMNDIESIKNFTLLWNLFEKYFCSKNANLQIIKNKIYQLYEENYILPEVLYNDYFAYFKNRYTSANKTNTQFESLNFRNGEQDQNFKRLLKSILESENPEIKDKALANFIIIYRLRNNLFHGSKNIATISEQNENFKIANKVIMEFLDFLKRNYKLVK